MLQLVEGHIVESLPQRGRSYVVLLKILLGMLLLSHTGELGINSSYYPIFYLPVVTAAIYLVRWHAIVDRTPLPSPTAHTCIQRCRNIP